MTDRVWRGYDLRAMAPAAAVAGVLSMGLLIARWLSDDLSALAEQLGLLFIYVPLAVIWGVLIGVGLYRSITYTYRLTDHALLVDRGFRWPPEPLAPLQDIVDVQARTDFPGRWFNVGRVMVATTEGRRIEMTGVHAPAAFAESIRAEAMRAKQS